MNWNFVPNNYKNHDVKHNAFSSTRGTKTDAQNWAIYLLLWNPSADYVLYMREGGRRVYSIGRVK